LTGGPFQWWNVDLGLPDLPIKDVVVEGRSWDSGPNIASLNHLVRVGNNEDRELNPSCTGTVYVPDLSEGQRVSCNLPGQHVSVVRYGDKVCHLKKVAVFLDCNLSTVWDNFIDTFILNLGETASVTIPLHASKESLFGVDICG